MIFRSLSIAVIVLIMMGMGAQTPQLEPNIDARERAAVATIFDVFAMIKTDFDEKRLHLTPTKPAERGLPVEIEGKQRFSRIMSSVGATCEGMGGDNADAYRCTKQFSDTKVGYKIYLYFKAKGDRYLLDSGILHVDKIL